MNVATAAAPERFELGMLWTDSRYRSYTIQIIALFLFMLAVAYLINNAVVNLDALGKPIQFRFMNDPASYDINQRLIEYTSRSSHSTAAIVGILNTLLIAVLGCMAATVIGVIAGVLRLSKNWLVSRLMTVYVEGIRNVPLLLQILLFAAAFDELLPTPRKAEAMDLFGLFPTGIVATNRGFYLPGPVLEAGAWVIGVAFIIGICAAVWFGRYAAKKQKLTGETLPTFWVKAGLIILLPLIAYFAMGMPVGLENPELKGFNFKGGIYARNSLIALWLALSIYTGAFIAENVRSGIMAVSHGQTEAAFALGLRANRTMSLIILPQALRVIIPPLISQYLNLTKNSSLAIAIGYMDATGTLGGITLNQTGREMETLLLLMAFYLTISLGISVVMNMYNEQMKLVERTTSTAGGFGFIALFASLRGPRELITRGQARDHDAYGITGLMNLVVLFYAASLVALLYYIFIASDRPYFWTWPLSWQIASILMLAVTFATLTSSLFKHIRFFDFVVLEAIIFIFAILLSFPVHALMLGESAGIAIAVGLVIRALIIFYVAVGLKPSVTYFNQVKAGEAP